MKVLAPQPAAHRDGQVQSVSQGMRPGSGRVGGVAGQQFEHVRVHGVAAAGEQNVASTEGPFLFAALGPNALHRAGIGRQQPGYPGIRANGDIASRHFAVELLQHDLEDRLAGFLGPEVTRNAVTCTARRRAGYGMAGKRNEALVEQPVQRIRRQVHGASNDVGVCLAEGDLHDVLVVAVGRIDDALVFLQPGAGRADLPGGHGQRAAQRIGRLQHQHLRAASRSMYGGRQPGSAGAHDEVVPVRFHECARPQGRAQDGQGGACALQQFSAFHSRAVYMPAGAIAKARPLP